MDIEIQAILYILFITLIGIVISIICNVIAKNEKISLIISYLFILCGAIYLSFFLLKDQNFLMKFSFPLVAFLFLVWHIATMPSSRIKKVLKEEQEWKREAFKR